MNRFQAYKNKDDKTSYVYDSDSDNDLNWLGDLLDPWKDSRENLKNLTTISTKNTQTYRNKNYEDRLIPQIKQLQHSSFFIKSHDRANSPTRIHKDFIVFDKEELFKESKPSYLLQTREIHNQKIQMTEQHHVQHALNSCEDEQQDQQVSFSMLFRHPFTNSKPRDKTFYCEQSTKREENIKKQQKTSKRAQNHNLNKVKFNDQTKSDKRQVIEYFPSLKKKTHKRYKAINKKLKIPPSQRHQLEENIIQIDQNNQKNLIKQKQSFLRKQNLMKLQANKNINLIECEQVQISFQEQDGINDAHSIHFQIEQFEQVQKQNFERNQEQVYVQNQQFKTRNDSIESCCKNIGVYKRQKRLNQKQQLIANELNEIIRIVGVRDNGNEKQYKWEIGTQSFWKSIGQALSSNFQIFIRTSKKYKKKFLKYLPKNIIQKKQSYNKFESRLQDQSISKIKLEKIRQYKIRSKNRQMYDLKDIFDKVSVSKIIQFERFIEEKGSQYARQEFEDGIFSEYEPDSNGLEGIIDDIVSNTNKSFRQRRCENNNIPQKQKELKATNQLLIQNLNKATETYNYIDSMKQLYNLNTKHPTLSCLDQKGLGLRSNNLKVIDKATFEQEMNRIRRMKEAIQLNDSDSYPIFQSNEKLEAEKKQISLKLQ